MKKFLWMACLLMFATPLFAEMSKEELQNMYLKYLRGRNIDAQIVYDGNIGFQYKLPTYSAITCFILVNEDDQLYFHIMVPNIYPLDTTQKKRQAPLAASHATRVADTVKVYVNSDGTDVIASGQVFIAYPDNFRFVLPKMMLQFEAAFDTFLDHMK